VCLVDEGGIPVLAISTFNISPGSSTPAIHSPFFQ
jgi:hypothetical protein